MNLQGKRALVTGAAQAISAEVARRLHEAGARVHVCDIDGAAAARFAAAHPGIGTHVCDVADECAVDDLFEALRARLGGLDILVNNAGVAGPTGRLEDLEHADWRRTLDVNLTGAFLCTRRACRF